MNTVKRPRGPIIQYFDSGSHDEPQVYYPSSPEPASEEEDVALQQQHTVCVTTHGGYYDPLERKEPSGFKIEGGPAVSVDRSAAGYGGERKIQEPGRSLSATHISHIGYFEWALHLFIINYPQCMHEGMRVTVMSLSGELLLSLKGVDKPPPPPSQFFLLIHTQKPPNFFLLLSLVGQIVPHCVIVTLKSWESMPFFGVKIFSFYIF